MANSGKHSWIEGSDVVSLFPNLVWKIQLRAEVHEPIDAAALGLLHSLRQGLPELKYATGFPCVFASLRRCQRQRRDPRERELQPDVFRTHRCDEQAAVGR